MPFIHACGFGGIDFAGCDNLAVARFQIKYHAGLDLLHDKLAHSCILLLRLLYRDAVCYFYCTGFSHWYKVFLGVYQHNLYHFFDVPLWAVFALFLPQFETRRTTFVPLHVKKGLSPSRRQPSFFTNRITSILFHYSFFCIPSNNPSFSNTIVAWIRSPPARPLLPPLEVAIVCKR